MDRTWPIKAHSKTIHVAPIHLAQAQLENITMTSLCVLGCGLMGSPMSQRLLDAGYPLTVWNRDPGKAAPLIDAGAQWADTPAQAVRAADIVITMLSDGAAVNTVLFDMGVASAMHGLRASTLVIDMSSILPEQAQAHAERLAKLGVHALDAPVSGGTLGAQAGTLAIMAGGHQGDFERAEAVLSVLGRPVLVGPHGSGQLCKLANQMIVGITIGAVAEALLLAQRGGADPAKVREALRGGFAESRILEVHGQRMVEGDFAQRGSLAIQLKDLRNALHTSAALSFNAPITASLAALYEAAATHSLSELDQSALFVELAQRQEPAA
jgi:3-hydroxyisobutyrate dehydrogenase-like beta-hydroxyacid dehydrogenase